MNGLRPIVAVGVFLAAVLVGQTGFAKDHVDANALQVNIWVYENITLEDMFSETGITVGEFFDRMYASLDDLMDFGSEDSAIVSIESYRLASRIKRPLKELCKYVKADGGGMYEKKAYLLFKEEIWKTNDAVKETVNRLANTVLFQPYKNGIAYYGILTACQSDLAAFPGWTYGDFFTVSRMNPSINQTMQDASSRLVEAGLFGKLMKYAHNADPETLTGSEDVETPEAEPKATYMCCDRNTRKCVSYSSATLSCSMCGSYCCLASKWCP